MKRVLMMVLLAIAGSATVFAQSAGGKPVAGKAQMSLADARGKIDQAIESPELMKEIMQQLSAEDQ